MDLGINANDVVGLPPDERARHQTGQFTHSVVNRRGDIEITPAAAAGGDRSPFGSRKISTAAREAS
jgi:hypothetical protein